MPDPVADYVKSRASWNTPEGRVRLRAIVVPRVDYEPDPDQIDLPCVLLSGTDVVLVKPTGGGKTTLITYCAMAEPDTVTLVCAPLNMLEENMVEGFAKLNIRAIAINSETLADARKEGRDLWAEARRGRYQVILMSPEMFLSDAFRSVIGDKTFASLLRRFFVDECHVILLWGLGGSSLRPKYSFLGDMRSILPEHVTFAAMTGTLAPGDDTKLVLRTLGFQPGRYFLERHDCERYDIDIFLRTLSTGIDSASNIVFPDLDWLVPGSLQTAADVPKTLLYCETIDLGHRVALYLRSLLPRSLSETPHRLIAHVHGLSCPDCKADSLKLLMQSTSARTCVVHVATDVLGMGIDVKDIKRVVCFGTPKSLADMLQHIGRAARARDIRGEAYIYVHQTDMKWASTEVERLHYDDVPAPRKRKTKAKASAPKALPAAESASTREKKCPAFDRVLLAAASSTCINLPINIVMGNPNRAPDYKCGACGTCLGDSIPKPRGRDNAATSARDDPTSSSSTVLADLSVVLLDLGSIAFELWTAGSSVRAVSSDVFLSSKWKHAIAQKLEAFTTLPELGNLMAEWRYWASHGDALAEEVLARRTGWIKAVKAARATRLAKAQSAAKKRKRKDERDDEQLLTKRAKRTAQREAEEEQQWEEEERSRGRGAEVTLAAGQTAEVAGQTAVAAGENIAPKKGGAKKKKAARTREAVAEQVTVAKGTTRSGRVIRGVLYNKENLV